MDARAQGIQRPYGLWASPISASRVAKGVRLEEVQWSGDGRWLVWLEGRSGEGVLVGCRWPLIDAPTDLTLEPPVRAQVGYGGGDFTTACGPAGQLTLFFCGAGGQLYRKDLEGGPARPITPAFGHAAAPAVSPDGRWLLYVHSVNRVDSLAVVDTEGRFWPQRLVAGDDFYMQPRWHPGSEVVAWVAWNHPNMPWDGTRLQLARLLPSPQGPPVIDPAQPVLTVAGGERVSVLQPEFSPDGRSLAYVSDETGWYNLYLHDLQTGTRRTLTQEEADCAGPAWRQGVRFFAFGDGGRAIYYLRNQEGFWQLWRVALEGGHPEPVDSPLAPYSALAQITAAPEGRRLAFIASSSAVPPRIVVLDLDSGDLAYPEGQAGRSNPGSPRALPIHRVVRRSAAEDLPESYFSTPKPLRWPVADQAAATGAAVVQAAQPGPALSQAYGLYYPPRNPRFRASGPPPTILSIHGGPTSQAIAGYASEVQFFTSRGFAVLRVNHRGSTGYGRAYWEALRGNWGLLDVLDTVAGARYLVEQGLADPERLVIMGGSAGGFTVLRALATHPGFFRAGICLYGVCNLFTLAMDTHKFEERYLDSLVGPLPQAAQLYRERSPIFQAERIRDPIALFQGTEDRVVPKEQSDSIAASLRARGVPHEYHVYEGEGHGFRRTETLQRFYEAVERFLRQYVVFA